MSLCRRLSLVVAFLLMCRPAGSAEPILHKLTAPGTIYSLAFSPDGKLLAAEAANLIYLWDTATGKEIRRIAEEPSPGVWSVVFSPDSKTIYAPLQDNTVAAWEVATGKLVRQFKGHVNVVYVAAISPDGKVLASGGEDATVRLWDTKTGKELFQLTHASGVWPFQFSHDGKELVSIGSDGTLYIWDVATGKSKKEFTTEPSIWPLALSSDGKTAATVVWQQTTLRLWDLRTGDEMRHLDTQAGSGWNLAFTPNGRLVAAGGPANTLCLWEAATGKERLRLTGHQAKIDAVACGPDGRTAATASADGKVIVWDLTGRLKNGRLLPAFSGNKPTANELDALWRDLAGKDGTRAHQAVWTLTAAAGVAVPDLTERLRKAVPAPVDAAKMTKLIADMDDNGFDVREKAATELDKLGAPALPAVRKALEKKLSAEQRQRLNSFVQKFSHMELPPSVVASRRAVEVLEQIGTPEARRALEQVLKSQAAEEVIEDARLSLRRMPAR